MILNPIDILKHNKCTIQEYNLLEEIGSSYFHTIVKDENGNVLSGGYGANILVSRKIAFAEYLERKQVVLLKNDPDMFNTWGFNYINTGCGFAAGFDSNATTLRSLAEAIERWTLSKFIDEQYAMEKIDPSVLNLDKVCNWFINQFESVTFYYKSVLVHHNGNFITLHVVMSFCVIADGVFQGSSVNSSLNNDLWLHALVESFRHLSIVKNSIPKNINKFPENKIRYYSRALDHAKSQVDRACIKKWPMPNIVFHKAESFEGDAYFLSRTIIGGWKSWSVDGTSRFLY